MNALLFTPALPLMSVFFGVTEAVAENFMTVFLIGYTLGQLVYGPFSNRYGRRRSLMIGTFMQIGSQLVCLAGVATQQFWLLLLGRFFMAIGSGVGLKMTFTLVSETLSPERASRVIALVSMAFALSPALSVAAGAYLTVVFGWESIFYGATVYGLIILLFIKTLPETCQHKDRDALNPVKLLQNLRLQFADRQLVCWAMMMGSTTAIAYLFATLAPFIAISEAGLSEKAFGLYNLVPAIGLVSGGLIAAHLSARVSQRMALSAGLGITAVSVVLMGVATYLKMPVLWMLFVPMITVNFGNALIYPNASVLALKKATDKSNASAVMSFINMGFATVMVLAAGFTTPGQLVFMAALVLLTIFMALCLWGRR
ncbi:MFS transporter [Legionella geestiana]|uniref:MFS transporter n=1 Tax=Legionella geestiana TaxID=45065 RepID=UPI00142F7645|nr:MFS transporter [Legionella geestiana]